MHFLRFMVGRLRRRKDFHTNHEVYESQPRVVSSLLQMAQSGDKNESFGIYKSACCGQEIVITGGATFPRCLSHTRLRTQWIAVDECQKPVRMVVFPERVMISHSDR